MTSERDRLAALCAYIIADLAPQFVRPSALGEEFADRLLAAGVRLDPAPVDVEALTAALLRIHSWELGTAVAEAQDIMRNLPSPAPTLSLDEAGERRLAEALRRDEVLGCLADDHDDPPPDDWYEAQAAAIVRALRGEPTPSPRQRYTSMSHVPDDVLFESDEAPD